MYVSSIIYGCGIRKYSTQYGVHNAVNIAFIDRKLACLTIFGNFVHVFHFKLLLALPTVDVPRLPQPAGSGGLPGGTLAGIAITALLVGVFVVALVGFVMYLVITRKKMTKTAMSPDR